MSAKVSDPSRTRAGFKAVKTLRARRAQELARRRKAAKAAWVTMRSAPFRAQRTAKRSQEALREWAKQQGWYVLFLDASSGYPRTGIVDAVMLRIPTSAPDELEVRLVQLKGGSAGLTAPEVARLEAAVQAVATKVKSLCVLHDGRQLHFQETWEVPIRAASLGAKAKHAQ
jgi:hypothetical protein